MITRSHPHGHAAARGPREHHADHTLESLGHEGAAHLLAERGDLRVLLVLHRRGDVGHQTALIGAEAELLEDGLANLRGDGHDHHHEHHDVVGLGRHRRLGRLGMERRDGKGQCFHGVRLDSVRRRSDRGAVRRVGARVRVTRGRSPPSWPCYPAAS